jgi:hypothetical protein
VLCPAGTLPGKSFSKLGHNHASSMPKYIVPERVGYAKKHLQGTIHIKSNALFTTPLGFLIPRYKQCII